MRDYLIVAALLVIGVVTAAAYAADDAPRETGAARISMTAKLHTAHLMRRVGHHRPI